MRAFLLQLQAAADKFRAAFHLPAFRADQASSAVAGAVPSAVTPSQLGALRELEDLLQLPYGDTGSPGPSRSSSASNDRSASAKEGYR
jgi:hypothetical protein